ncbi:hypothetical protein AB0D40_34210 [Streptomyces massasporeus]|uniref:hypothetical protein n=1 Tax=Streptomyces massasporeus TaxID=67324 RepID=UPI0033C5FD51
MKKLWWVVPVAAAGAAAVRRSWPARRPGGRTGDRWPTVTVNRPPADVGPEGKLPPPLDDVAERIDVQIRPAPGDRGTELAARFKSPCPPRRPPCPRVRPGRTRGRNCAVINKGLTVRGAQMHGQRYIPMLLDRLASGEIETSHLATHTLSLDQAPTAYDMFKEKTAGCVRAVIRPQP